MEEIDHRESKLSRVDKILNHDYFLQHLQQNNTAEADRRFCRHNIVHFLDVARIAELINLEEKHGLERDIIYAAALLHDIGKHIQYEDGTPHEVASARIAPGILQDCNFTAEETRSITDAILSHRDKSVQQEPSLRGILYRADKASRACFACEAREECNWPDSKKNLKICF